MSLIKQLLPSSLKFTPASAGVNWRRINTLVHGPGAPGWDQGSDGDGNSAVFACLMAIASSFPEAPLRVFQQVDEGKEDPLPSHPLQDLLANPTPNGELTTEELLFWTVWALHTDGNAYWIKVRAGDEVTGNVVELWPVSPTVVEPFVRKGSGDWISGYRHQYEPGKFEIFPVENVVHFRMGIDDNDMRKGLSPLKRLARQISTDSEADKFTDALLKNYAVPGLVVIPVAGATISPDDADRIKTDFRRKYSNDGRGNVAVMPKEADIRPFGFSPEELDLGMLHRIPEERIAAVMGVPAIIAGLGAGLERATYSNFREAREMFTEQKLVPLWRRTAGTINTALLPDFDSQADIKVNFDLTSVRALQEDMDAVYQRVNVGVQGKWITINEARTAVGLPPVEGKDELPEPQQPPDFSPNGDGPDDEDEQPGEMARNPARWRAGHIREGPTARMRPFRLFGEITHKADNPAEQQLDDMEAAGADEIYEALQALFERQWEGITEDNVTLAVLRLQQEQVTAPFRRVVTRLLQSWALRGVEYGQDVVEREVYGTKRQHDSGPLDVDWTLANNRAAQWALRYGYELVSGIIETTRNRLQSEISWFIQTPGATLGDLVERIQWGNVYSPERAQMIARTELTRAWAQGNQEAWRESGVVQHRRWQTRNDELVCPICGPLNQQVAPMDGTFPGGTESPPAHPRCRCWLTAAVDVEA